MLQLRLLGTLDLRDREGDPVVPLLVQPKRAALLAYLAAAPEDGLVARETLLALFWPELPAGRARNNLSQALHFISRTLGDGVLERYGQQLRVAVDRLWCDVPAFHQALRTQPPSALRLYRGGFLEGHRIRGLRELERWAETERALLQDLAAEAAWRLARQAAADAHGSEALGLARRAFGLRPSEGDLRRLLAVAAEVGEAGFGLSVLRRFEQDLRAEHGLAPSEATRAAGAALGRRDETPEKPLPHG